MSEDTLPCINCLILGRCRAHIFDDNPEIYGQYHKSVTINKLMNECSLLKEYMVISDDKIDIDKIGGLVDYLVSGVEHDT